MRMILVELGKVIVLAILDSLSSRHTRTQRKLEGFVDKR